MPLNILKADGESEQFDPEKLEKSLVRVGANDEIRAHILKHIKAEVTEGMATQQIYERAFQLLREGGFRPVAARYSVKRAVLDLGPSGFPFERFIAEIFRTLGYVNVRAGVALQGKCVPHEVDIVAEHNGVHMAAEVKFHNNLGMKTDVKDALYVKARFDDLSSPPNSVTEAWLITNTRFTRNAIRYAQCVGLKLLGWDYPNGKGIEVLLDRAQVHPITALTTLTEHQKRRMLDANLVLCRQLLSEDDFSKYDVSHSEMIEVVKEAESLCGVGT